jgi:hypothetical protein
MSPQLYQALDVITGGVDADRRRHWAKETA